MKLEEWIDSELGRTIWHNKYQHNGESFSDWLVRVSGGNKDISKLIYEKKFLFGGRILANRGINDRKCSYSNCYVLPGPDDNLESIFRTAYEAARTYSYGGGVGFNLSYMAPKGATIHNAAQTTSGAVSFMDLYNQVSELICQNGRRGALMMCMNDTHPDIEDFIDIKNDLSKINKANISVMSGDYLMKAAESNTTFNTNFFRVESEETISKQLNGRDLLMHIAKNAWKTGEPGMLFSENMNNNHLMANYKDGDSFFIDATNPCVTGDTIINTVEGQFPIKELVGQEPYVYCMNDDGQLDIKKAHNIVLTRKNAELVEIDFKRGKLRCTPDHLIYTRNRGYVKAKDLKPKDKLNGLSRHMCGERYCNVKLGSEPKSVKEHRFILGHFENILGYDVHHINNNTLDNRLSNLEKIPHDEHSTLSNLKHEPYVERDTNNGQYMKKDNKARKNQLHINKQNSCKNYVVSSVKFIEECEDVYDMTVEGVHNFLANDIVVHNCGEEGMIPYDSCLLGSMNLSEYVEGSYFNIELLEKDLRTVVRAMNDVQAEGVSLHPLEAQRDIARKYRRIGIGIMGFADTLIKLGIPYSSENAYMLAHKIGSTMINVSLSESARMAKMYGAFSMFDYTKVSSTKWYKKVVKPETDREIKEYGIYNSALLSIAPTGSISTMLGVSGGAEPIFDLSYTRKTESLNGHDEYYKVYTPIVKQYMDEHCIDDESELPNYFETARNIHWKDRVDMQSVWQDYIDAGISSTVNLPEKTTVEDIYNIYMYAWKLGLKGITVFRDNCERVGILTNKEDKKEEKKEEDTFVKIVPDDVVGKKRKLVTGCGSLHCVAFFDRTTGRLMEIYLGKGSTGGCNNYMNGLARMISLSARSGSDIADIVDQLDSTGVCPSYAVRSAKYHDTSKGSCCPMAIGNVLVEMYNEMQEEITNGVYDGEEFYNSELTNVYSNVKIKETLTSNLNNKTDAPKNQIITSSTHNCPECGEPLIHEGGCDICKMCGYSKCS